jgi:hypothetical protein
MGKELNLCNMNGDFSPGLEALAPTLFSCRSAEKSLVFLRAEFAFRAFSLKQEKRNNIDIEKMQGKQFCKRNREIWHQPSTTAFVLISTCICAVHTR